MVFRVTVCTYLTVLSLWIIASLTGAAPGYEQWPKGWVYLIHFVNVSAWIIAYRLKKDPVDFFNSLSDKRAIGFLIEVVSLRNTQFGYDKKSRKLASEALIRLLNDLHNSNEVALTAAQRLALANIALKEDNGKLVNAIIEALAQIGRGESVLPLESLAAFGSKYQDREVRDAARNALIQVRERAERDKVHSVLLRPAEGDSNQEATLVRPSIAPAKSAAATLLRKPEEEEIPHVGR